MGDPQFDWAPKISAEVRPGAYVDCLLRQIEDLYNQRPSVSDPISGTYAANQWKLRFMFQLGRVYGAIEALCDWKVVPIEQAAQMVRAAKLTLQRAMSVFMVRG